MLVLRDLLTQFLMVIVPFALDAKENIESGKLYHWWKGDENRFRSYYDI